MALFGFLRKGETGLRLDELPISRIKLNPNRPRKLIDEEGLAELAQSIANSGLLRPLAVRKKGADYELISGERRLLALKMLGCKRALCIVTEGGEDPALMAMIEDALRESPDYFEMGECCLKLMNRLRLSSEELAGRIGKSGGYVENKLRVLRLEPTVRDRLRHYALSERHALAALTLHETAKRLELVRAAGERSLSAEETERLARRMLEDGSKIDGTGAAMNADLAKKANEDESGFAEETRKPKKAVVRLVKDYRVFLNTVDIACEQLRSGGLKVDMDKADREDGLDIMIRVTREKVRPRGEKRAL